MHRATTLCHRSRPPLLLAVLALLVRGALMNSIGGVLGATLNDQFSRGVTRDRAAEREFPYECKRDGRRFLTATALSEHLLEAYGERLHPSLIRPAKAKKITDDLSDDE